MSSHETETMHDVADAEAPETAAPAPVMTIAEQITAALAETDDGSSVTDAAAVVAAVEELTPVAAMAGDISRNLTEVCRAIAKGITSMRHLFRKADGNVDWAGSTRAYKGAVETIIGDSFGDMPKNERNNLLSRIRMQVKRTYLQIAVETFVAAVEKDGVPVFEGILDETGSPDPTHESWDVFKAMVRRQYIDAGLAVPVAYQTPQDKANAASDGGNNGGNDAVSVLSRSGEVFKDGKARDDILAASILENISALFLNAANPQRDGGIRGREVVGEFADRIHSIAYGLKKACDGVLTADDREALSADLWNVQEDPAKLRKD